MTTKAESLGLRNPNNIVFSEYVPTLRQAYVPSNLIGMLLDYGKASAHALKLLAIKSLKGDGFVLNETYVRDRYKVKREAFQAGIRLLKQTGVLDRDQPNHRAFAKEKLARRGDNFITIDEDLLAQEKTAPLIGFIMAVKVSMIPGMPIGFAKRIGVTSRGTAQRLAKQAQQYGCDILVGTGTQPMVIGRGGSNFEQLFKKQPTKKQPAKKQPTHSRCKDSTVDERTPQNLKTASYATPNPDGLGGRLLNEDFQERQIVLKSWKMSKFWQERDLHCRKPDWDKFSIDTWRRHLNAYGGSPDHMHTMHSFRQAVEITTELAYRMDDIENASFVLQALAYWVCKAHADGRRIHSLGFITEPLCRACDVGDYEWCFEYPSHLSDAEYAQVLDFAQTSVDFVESRGISVYDHMLLSTQGIEDLSALFRYHGRNEYVASANRMLSDGEKPSEGCSVIRWSWFTKRIPVKQPRKGRGRR